MKLHRSRPRFANEHQKQITHEKSYIGEWTQSLLIRIKSLKQNNQIFLKKQFHIFWNTCTKGYSGNITDTQITGIPE